ncbi:MAG: cation-transporting P-type ATPase [Acidimicrobiia bacterium]|nr:cation-transporting P-type ATPase [Acidimicrobiia bacterium]
MLPGDAGAPGPGGPSHRDSRGLTSEEAATRLRRDGPNVLPAPRGPAPWRRLARQMVHFFALMLWVASGLAFVADLPQLGVAIVAVILVNGVFSFAQEHRAERAARALRDLLPRRATVVRDGVAIDVDAAGLVVDDVVLLRAGDRVSADLRALEAHSLSVDTSTLTGESVPVPVGAGEGLLAGTFVVEGEGVAVVTGVGSSTRLAGIARLTRAARRPPSPLARELRRVVRTISLIAVGVGTGFFGLALLLDTPAGEGFIFAIGVTVALVPEALLPTVTLSLAIGAQRMAERDALVRRLESVETLGSTTFICTDKTGTLTLNEMSVVEAWTPEGWARIRGDGYAPTGEIDLDLPAVGPALAEAARVGARCSTGRAVEEDGRWRASGDPMEAALDVLARRAGAAPGPGPDPPERARFPFDPRRRRMSLVVGETVLVKGAPDAVLARCRPVEGAAGALGRMTGRGLRVLAVAARPVGATLPAGADAAETGLDLLGLMGLEDPPRPDVAPSIAACRRAGIKLAMVTGDHPDTARAVAEEVGLLGPDAPVVVGADLPADEEALADLLDRDGAVVARVAPEDKLRIARALQRRGHVVAMTGDGVNDGPALQEADIGVAMGRSGTDVAREASDLVLLDDHFSTIVAAIEQGRATFANSRRFLTYHLSDNVAELTPFAVWALSGGRFPLALGVLQILALDIGTDTLSAVALGAEPPGRRALERPPVRGRLLDRRVARRAFGLLGPVEAAVEMAAFLVALAAAGWRPGDPFPTGTALLAASGAAFAAVVVGQTANAFACRSTTRWPGALGWCSNRLLVGAVVVELAVAGACLFVPGIADVLDHAAPPLAGWAVALLAAPAVLGADALDKWARRPARGARRARLPVPGPWSGPG